MLQHLFGSMVMTQQGSDVLYVLTSRKLMALITVTSSVYCTACCGSLAMVRSSTFKTNALERDSSVQLIDGKYTC